MREIKFQLVWQWAIYEPLDMSQIILWKWDIEWKMYEDDKNNWNKKWDFVSLPIKDYVYFSEEEDFGIWRQFTWLHDKNGKEIYEGDVVREWSPPDNGFWPCPIVYEVVYKWDRFWFYDITLQAFITNFNLRNLAEHYEIIWNIYENPDIL